MATTYQFAHYRFVEGDRCLIWGNGLGDVCIPVGSAAHREALASRRWLDNNLTNEGEEEVLNTYFRTMAKKSNLYGRLYDVAAPPPADAATLAALGTEVTGTGYAAVTWPVSDAGFPTSALDSGAWKVTSSVQTFTATGAWTAADYLALATVATTTTGKLVAWVALSATRTLAASDTLDVSVSVKLD